MSIAAFDSLLRVTGPTLVDRLNAGIQAIAFRSLAHSMGVSVEALATALGLTRPAIHWMTS
jgi:hypothetical protein